MGNTLQKAISSDPFPDSEKPTFDPMFGFPRERKQRVMPLSEEEMIAAKIPHDLRDYCAHYYLDYIRCYMEKFPFVTRCVTEIHNYQKCEYDDYILRGKEYERERRLLVRERNRQEALKAAA
ncbi:NADH dehydrogenase [ubiquinone] 1 beta subcomplex subunit 7 [Apis mellifera caucasica]|uniref:NADH dehydrogenase [ubiquinone] 1 beta subcomplex subunit 7 n=1 Tax=Apis mellifera TaxID=7460 RepID=A0A7M7G7M5_APIME|nr:NADH dehydrogenase [ubiquinone] 1 beta subcomplex subunit 7 [Apis mellifera]KAG6796221.1 NADH dehydrogenase [ubiquinone] 1 beta subcomplex subunit 7 [Apis mellifera caucasica]KAG9427945.1 NADH dehydrogenase [ubiquinone] 1 beta subcomplex subunit 7 [Apis mellifera carnica]|eukprot:XP_001120728.1 NADH dehydrogenase [ubiquinone] 1 beta subcomplex subunit 7 [Apis mellifera]